MSNQNNEKCCLESPDTKDLTRFIKTSVCFALVLCAVLMSGFSYMEAIPSLLNAYADKVEMLKKAGSPKIVILGGSNASFGFNSQLINDEFKLPVVNMGVYAEIGFRFVLKDVEQYLGPGDIVVSVPEYANFSSDFYYGSRGLIAVVFDVYRDGMKHLSTRQWMHLFPFAFNYSAVKVKRLPDYLFRKITGKPGKSKKGIYSRDSFNSFGDAYIHWEMGPRSIPPAAKVVPDTEKVNQLVLAEYKEFEERVQKAGVKTLLLPPCYQARSYNNQKWIIDKIAEEINSPFYVPSRYIFEDEDCFDSPFHLVKSGVDKRTRLVIEDLKNFFAAD